MNHPNLIFLTQRKVESSLMAVGLQTNARNPALSGRIHDKRCIQESERG